MPQPRPTLFELIDRTRSDFRGRLGTRGQLLRRSMVDIVASVWSGVVHTCHGHLDWLGKQIFATTSEREALIEDASTWGMSPTAAEFAVGSMIATGVDGAVVPDNVIISSPDGVLLRVLTGNAMSGTTATIDVQAVLAGVAGNFTSGDVLVFESPLPGIDSSVTVDSGSITGGVDAEDTEDFRVRFLLRKREPPNGGSDQDYEAWALAVPGVTRAWVYRHELGLGTVVVRCVTDDAPSIFPGPTTIAAVQASLDDNKPTTSEPTAGTTVPLAVDYTIAITPDNSEVRQAVTNELTDLLFRDGLPADAAGRGTIKLSRIQTAVGVSDGVSDYTIVSPAADVVPAVGELVTMGVITWA